MLTDSHMIDGDRDGVDMSYRNVTLRQSAFRVFAGCPNLMMEIQTDAVLGVLGRGLQDQYSIEFHWILVGFHLFMFFFCFWVRFDMLLYWLQWYTFLPLKQLSFPNEHCCYLPC